MRKFKCDIDEELLKHIISQYIQDDKIPKKFKTQRKLSEKFGVGRLIIKELLDKILEEIKKIPKPEELTTDRKITNMQISFIEFLDELYDKDKIPLMVKFGLEITSAQFIYCLRKTIEDYKKEKSDRLALEKK